jgi:glycosyltransferase involved in cell wall biosynthesis
MRLAIVHDYLNQFGGAERVIAALHELYPDAPIYTSIYDERRLPAVFQRMDIRTSFMQKLPLVKTFFKYYFMLYPIAFEQFDLSEYDVILSSSSAYAKGIKKRAGQLHICYCYTPARFIWRYDDYVRKENIPPLFKQFLPFFLEPLKKWDRNNTKTVDHFVAISAAIAERIKKIYGRESDIIYPPVETAYFRPATTDGDYYLIVSRLNAYKRIDLAVSAFNELDLPLKIVGAGPARRQLAKLARPNIEFLGRRSDEEVKRLLSECRALIFPGEEDFGIVPLEALASGRPVIAYRAGGAVETLSDGETGIFFDEQSPRSLINAVNRFKFTVFSKEKLRAQALKFDKKVFQDKIERFIREKYEKKSAGKQK